MTGPNFSRIGQLQRDLLAFFWRQADADGLVLWSAEAYLGQPPTRSESAKLSEALIRLEARGLVDRVRRGKAKYTTHVRVRHRHTA